MVTTRQASSEPSIAECLVFAYGSLINPASVRRTLPDLDEQRCLPAYCIGMLRTFGVAFPNDGSQTDKWYADDRGHRPPRILFADLRPDPDITANGVLIPATKGELERLVARELRYDLVEVSNQVTLWDGTRAAGRVGTFVGRSEFTRPVDVATGVVPAGYVASIHAGARFWDRRARGFEAAFTASTLSPPPERISSLTRFDKPAALASPPTPRARFSFGS